LQLLGGGVVIGRLLSDFLSIPISHVSVSSYVGMHQEKEPVITQELTADIRGKTILLVDDVSDTGKTFKKTIAYLQQLGATKILTVSAYIKPHATYIPDFFAESLDAWIIFPYEVWETQDALQKQFGEKTKEVLVSLGTKVWELHE